ncbi:MAG TPA: hypothetical protein VKB19_11495 [Pedobacter sp.]|nr:hypothetical protein [Pedobacter sp.]
MKPFYFTISDSIQVMVIPDADAHMDGHPVLTYSYTIYSVSPGAPKSETVNTDALLTPDKRKNPDYLGTIFFDQPYKAFTYTCDGINELNGDQVQDIIERITLYRTHQSLWRL